MAIAESGLGPLRACLILNAAGLTFKSLSGAFPLSGECPSNWDEVLEKAQLTSIERKRLNQNRREGFAEKEIAAAQSMGYSIIHAMDDLYPALLRQIPDPPAVIYVQGGLEWLSRPSIALVGSRNATAYGKTVASRLASQLVASGLTVVSGFARGIDRSAHEGALRAGGGTIAVLGCSLDMDYPAGHGDLRKAVALQGCLISEFPIGTAPAEYTFPRRNRIISGISLGTVVVEAMERSGALITARHAMEQGREVFAVPGPVFSPTSRGSHALIKDGAKLVEGIEDILDELKAVFVPKNAASGERARTPIAGSVEARVLDIMTSAPVHVDDLGRQLSLSMSSLMPVLSMLELSGCIRQEAGKMFSRL